MGGWVLEDVRGGILVEGRGPGGVCGKVWVGLPVWKSVCRTKTPVHIVN